MCGIFALLNKEINNNIYKSFLLGQSRGPENSIIQAGTEKDNFILGFHRLAINGLDMISNQPINLEHSTVICNGEIYNYKELAEKYNVFKKVATRFELPDGSKQYGKTILNTPTKYFTQDVMDILEECAKKEFKYGGQVKQLTE